MAIANLSRSATENRHWRNRMARKNRVTILSHSIVSQTIEPISDLTSWISTRSIYLQYLHSQHLGLICPWKMLQMEIYHISHKNMCDMYVIVKCCKMKIYRTSGRLGNRVTNWSCGRGYLRMAGFNSSWQHNFLNVQSQW